MRGLESTKQQKHTVSQQRIPELLVLVVICVVAATVRLLFLASWKDTVLFSSPIGDEMNFHQTAQALLGVSSSSENVFLYQPLYSFFLVLVYTVFGIDIEFVRTLQMILGVINCLVFYALGCQLGGRWVGRLSALMVALYGPLVFFESQMLAPVLCVPLTAGAYTFLLMAANRKQLGWTLPAGLLIGFAMMGRPNLSVVLPVGAIWLMRLSWSWKRRGLGLGLAICGVALGMSPSWVHNVVKGGEIVPVSTAGGHSFYIGNCPNAPGVYHVPRGLGIELEDHDSYRRSFVRIAEREVGKPLTPSQVSSYWFHRGLEFYQDQPWDALRLLGRKVLFSIHSEEMAIHHPYVFAKDWVPWLKILLTFGIVFPFSLVGMLFFSEPMRKIALLSWSAMAYMLTLVAFYVADRYRILMLPMLVPLAGAGLMELLRRFRRVSKHDVLWPLLVIFIACVASHLPIMPSWYRPNCIAFSYNWMGSQLMARGQLDEAERLYQRAVELAGHNRGAIPSTTWMRLGQLREKCNDLDGARDLFLRSAKSNPENVEVRWRLGRLAEIKGHYSEAIHWLEQVASLKIDPAPTRKWIRRIQKVMQEQAQTQERSHRNQIGAR